MILNTCEFLIFLINSYFIIVVYKRIRFVTLPQFYVTIRLIV